MGTRPGSWLPVAALIGSVLLLGGCGGSSHPKTRATSNTQLATSNTQLGVGESIRLDNCTDWRKATVAERRDTVAQLRKFAGGPVGSSAGVQKGSVLSDDRAYKIFQSYCANRFARGFKLYKLYTRAASFIGH